MTNMRKWLPALLLAACLTVSLPLAAQAQCGGGSGGGYMNHNNHMGYSSGMMSSGSMGMGTSGPGGQGTMGPGMMGTNGAPAGTWSQPAAPGNNMGSGQMGNMGPMDHSQMGHGGSGTSP